MRRKSASMDSLTYLLLAATSDIAIHNTFGLDNCLYGGCSSIDQRQRSKLTDQDIHLKLSNEC